MPSSFDNDYYNVFDHQNHGDNVDTDNVDDLLISPLKIGQLFALTRQSYNWRPNFKLVKFCTDDSKDWSLTG